ncbi:MAG: DUF5615 family PIN-like protein [Bacteroidota bacterium]
MKFLVDANLPFKLVLLLRSKQLDVIHTDNLPQKEFTTDQAIRKVSLDENRIVITKDADFLDSHLIRGIPSKLIFIATGNISNKLLLSLIDKYFDTIMQLFDHYDLIELNNEEIVGHERIGN